MQSGLKLVAASLSPPPGLAGLLDEFSGGENGFTGTPFARGEQTLPEFLRDCVDGADPARTKPGLVPQTVFWLVDDAGTAVGMVKVRHRLNDMLLIRGGHIGYYIRRDRRGRGYGREALRLALIELRKLGQARALITIRPDNAASIRVAEANGGRFEDERIDPDTGLLHRRYWIEL